MNGFKIAGIVCLCISLILVSINVFITDSSDKLSRALWVLILVCITLYIVLFSIGVVINNQPDYQYKQLLKELEDAKLNLEHFYIDHPEYRSM